MTSVTCINSEKSHILSEEREGDQALTVTRIFPQVHPGTVGHPRQPGLWPACWIAVEGNRGEVLVASYRLQFTLPSEQSVRLHLTGDERYEFFIDGKRACAGPERGDKENWFFETIEVLLSAGEHCFVARVWSMGEKAPFAQISVEHGFLLCPDQPELLSLLATGLAGWQGMELPGFEWTSPVSATWATGWRQVVLGSQYAWGHERGSGNGWGKIRVGAYGDSAEGVQLVSLQRGGAPLRRLKPASLPMMLHQERRIERIRHLASFCTRPAGLKPIFRADHLADEAADWQALIDGKGDIKLPAHTKRRIVMDLGDYLCGYPHLVVSGGKGSRIDISWTEALYEQIDRPEDERWIEAFVWPKGNRDEIEGKFFICPWYRLDGPGDTFLPDGGARRAFSPLWWISGRYLQVLIETGEEPLLLHQLSLHETRYPLEMEGQWKSSSEMLNRLLPMMVRGLQCCAHETYMDCPFYEQLMYAGDTRLEMLTTYVLTRDTRLPEKALALFDASRLPSGLIQSRYPAHVRQIIPPFSLWWIAMCHDHALWRGNAPLIKKALPGIRAVSDYFAALIDESGLLQAAKGWNFSDWVPQWKDGVSPYGHTAPSALLSWHAAMVFRMASELEEWCGEAEIAALQKRRALTIANATHGAFWNEERGLYADDQEHKHWSEHTQCLALLSDLLPAAAVQRLGETLFQTDDLTRTSVYFRHYLFEACRKLGRGDEVLKRMKEWFTMLNLGLKTPLEQLHLSRSDCHAWSSHPLFHFYATFAGIRPAAWGFSEISIEPLVPCVEQLVFPHPAGDLKITFDEGLIRVKAPSGIKIHSSHRLELIFE